MITFEEHKIAIVGFGQTDAACQLWGMCTYKNDAESKYDVASGATGRHKQK